MTYSFYCNKRFDISFSDFHRLIKIILPTGYTSLESRGIYRLDYCPCNIIEIWSNNPDSENQGLVAKIYSWLGQKGLTVLSDNELGVSLCLEALKEVKQNPEDYKILSFKTFDEIQFSHDEALKDYLVYKQINASKDTSKYIIKEYNGDEVEVTFYYNPDSVRLSGATSSLLMIVQTLIQKYSS